MAGQGIRIDPTASVCPTAVLEGSVTVGPYSDVNHGATMHGTHLGDEAAVGGNTCDTDRQAYFGLLAYESKYRERVARERAR